MKPRKKLGKGVVLKSLTLKVRRDIWLDWKMQAAKEDTTMSELAERLVTDYLKRKGGK